MSYIEREKVLEQFKSLEQLARKRVYDTPTNSPAYERYSTQYYEREKALSIIKAQPTADVVEVVRCEHCKYAEYCYDDVFDCRCPNAPWKSDEYSIFTNANDYCSYGERREENEG